MIRLLLALLTFWPLAPEAQPATATLRIEVSGLDGSRGTARIAVFDSEAEYLQTPAFASIRSIVRGRSVWVLRVPRGTYAIAVHHDEDNDGEMDTGLFGIPSEPHGFSNNARGRFGPPSWKATRTVVGEGTTTVRIRTR